MVQCTGCMIYDRIVKRVSCQGTNGRNIRVKIVQIQFVSLQFSEIRSNYVIKIYTYGLKETYPIFLITKDY